MDEDEIQFLLDIIDLWSKFHGGVLVMLSPCADPFSDSVCALDMATPEDALGWAQA